MRLAHACGACPTGSTPGLHPGIQDVVLVAAKFTRYSGMRLGVAAPHRLEGRNYSYPTVCRRQREEQNSSDGKARKRGILFCRRNHPIRRAAISGLLGWCGSGTSGHNGAAAPHRDPSYLPPQGIYRLPSSDSASFFSYAPDTKRGSTPWPQTWIVYALADPASVPSPRYVSSAALSRAAHRGSEVSFMFGV